MNYEAVQFTLIWGKQIAFLRNIACVKWPLSLQNKERATFL